MGSSTEKTKRHLERNQSSVRLLHNGSGNGLLTSGFTHIDGCCVRVWRDVERLASFRRAVSENDGLRYFVWVVTLVFAMIFKILPDVKLAWSDVWTGAAATSALFTIGKFLIGLCLGKGSVGSDYGAAASVIIMIVWVYYSAQILFLGAEFTRVYANRYGSRVVPADNAEPISAEKRAQQGLTPKTGPAVQGEYSASTHIARSQAVGHGFLTTAAV
jgi:uncharacterized BrkB/YihY/UPF0761 family membrane protein